MKGGRRLRHLRDTAAREVVGHLPGGVVQRWAQGVGAVSRYTGRTPHGAWALSRALSLLTAPPRRGGAEGGPFGAEEIARSAGCSEGDVEAWAEAGLLGPPAEEGPPPAWPAASLDRARLVAYLRRHGVSDGELVDAASQDRLPLLVVDRAVAGTTTLTAAEAAARAGLPVDFAETIWSALGMPRSEPDAKTFSRRDVEALRILGALRGVYADDALTDTVAVMGRGMAQIAASQVELFRRGIATRLADAGAGELEMALRTAAMVDLLVPVAEVLLSVAHRRHLEAAVRAESVLRIEEASGALPDQVEMCVGFADLVGFTRASTELSPLELGELSSRLLRIAERCVAERRVRIVKTIGDAVMFAGRDAPEVGSAAVALLAAATEADLPDLRVGLAIGPVLPRHADYFGRTVNVAARLCGAAHRGTALLAWPAAECTREDFAAAGLRLSRPHTPRLKGLGRSVRAVTLNPAR